MFIVAQALVGFACNAFYTVGFAFIEEQSPVTMAGIYFGLVRMGSSAGPIAGYIGGAFALGKWVDFDSNPDFDEIDTKHPGWVGAWWISTGMMI